MNDETRNITKILHNWQLKKFNCRSLIRIEALIPPKSVARDSKQRRWFGQRPQLELAKACL